MAPVSSETTMTTASVSSVMPMAARWRVPSFFCSWSFCESGKRHPAARIDSPAIMTPPSCRGDRGKNREVSSSAETMAARGVPLS